MQVAAEHPEAVGQRARHDVEERFLLDRVALHAADVAPRRVEIAAAVEAYLADADRAVGDRTAVAAREAADAAVAQRFVDHGLSRAGRQQIGERRHASYNPTPMKAPFIALVVRARHAVPLPVLLMRRSSLVICHLWCILLTAAPALAQNSTEAGRFVVEHPTLLNLGFEWAIRGDANRNATVAVEFRAVGEAAWRKGLPLVRIGGENVYRRRENLDYTVPDGFAGSILNLEPGTEYECRFELTDPDGVSGEASQTVRVRTRTEPQPCEGRPHAARVSARLPGPRQEPSFTSLLQAYYGAGLGDWSVVWERRAQPGDTILVHAGLYKPERTELRRSA